MGIEMGLGLELISTIDIVSIVEDIGGLLKKEKFSKCIKMRYLSAGGFISLIANSRFQARKVIRSSTFLVF